MKKSLIRPVSEAGQAADAADASPARPQPAKKPGLHPRNPHRERYDFPALIATSPELGEFVRANDYGNDSIDFADPAAVKALNRALLLHFYGVQFWDLPDGYLCPPIPGRADYIHHLADLLARCNHGKVPPRVNVLDVGVGANCIYPIIGRSEYGWRFVGSDIDPVALRTAKAIVDFNPRLTGGVQLRQQHDPENIFEGIIQPNDDFDLTICNPPFHASAAAAEAASRRKITNLTGQTPDKPVLNFGGQSNELWCPGGEESFLVIMAEQSRDYADQCCWFSSLVSREDLVAPLLRMLRKLGARRVETLKMAQGQKISRAVAWTFFDPAGLEEWRTERWK